MRRFLLLLSLGGCGSWEKVWISGSDLDRDADGFTFDKDCQDDDPDVNPDVDEVCDGVDNDCDGEVDEDEDDQTAGDRPTWYTDADGDGYGDPLGAEASCIRPDGFVAQSSDCDDLEAQVNPDAEELLDDGVDSNCDGLEHCYADADLDGYRSDDEDEQVVSSDLDCEDSGEARIGAPAGDCNDADPRYNPGARESCDVSADDYNCDGSTGLDDRDGDGANACEDCDDRDAAVNRDAEEGAGDLKDQNCDGQELCLADVDGDRHANDDGATVESDDVDCGDDGEATELHPADDCDDHDPRRYPGASEVCDGVDNDCDEDVDEDIDAFTTYVDGDGDGFGSDVVSREDVSCADLRSGESALSEDCDDGGGAVHPDADEICDGVDNDCDGEVDDDDPSIAADDLPTWYIDYDGDGDGCMDCAHYEVVACDAPEGYAASATDCDDRDAQTYLGAEEDCDDGVVNDCGEMDEALAGCLEASLDAADLTITTDDPSDAAGISVAVAGDVNGDGEVDLLVGALGNDADESAPTYPGTAYVVLGPISGGTMDLSDASVAAWTGEAVGDDAGRAVAGPGDVNCDGVDDVLVGARWAGKSTMGKSVGAAYLLQGPIVAGTSSSSLSEADVKFVPGDPTDDAALGDSVSGAGDVDGDGCADLLIGAIYTREPDGTDGTDGKTAGAAYVVLGELRDSSVSEVSLTASNYWAMLTAEAAGDHAGVSVSSGDVDGDDTPDILVGAREQDGAATDAGAAYIVLGESLSSSGSTLSLADADARLTGEHAGDQAGFTVAGGGDVNMDGYDDVLVGARGPEGEPGAAYLVLGPVTSMSLSEADAELDQEGSADYQFVCVSTPEDVDGDGADDLLIGASRPDDGSGVSSAVYLLTGPLSGTMSLASGLVTFTAPSTGTAAGASVHMGDVDGDGWFDLLIGAPGAPTDAAYLVLGGF